LGLVNDGIADEKPAKRYLLLAQAKGATFAAGARRWNH